MEIARTFFRADTPELPAPLRGLLASTEATAGFVPEVALPEFETYLPPPGSSGPRNHDVWVRGECGGVRVGLGIEAKADEAFDGSLRAKERYAARRVARGQATDMGQ